MGVDREEYVVIGCCLDDKFTKKLWKREDRDEIDELYCWEKEREDQIQYLTDGMSGQYTMFGFIRQLSDGQGDENYEMIEFEEPTSAKKQEIAKKFKELFPEEKMPEVKMYYLPHYT